MVWGFFASSAVLRPGAAAVVLWYTFYNLPDAQVEPHDARDGGGVLGLFANCWSLHDEDGVHGRAILVSAA